jgi:hypothetical protein
VNATLSKKFKTAHVCPLVPLILEEVAGGLARDVEMLAMWLHKVYGTGIRGLGEVWSCVASHAQHFTIGSTLLQYEEVVKVSLPSSLDSPGTETFFFKFRSSSPARLCSMDRKVIFELLQILIHLLKKNFSVNISPEVILPRAPPEVVNLAASNHIICVGSSIIQQTVPYIRALGYSVTDLSKPGWLATQDNIDALIKELSALSVPPGFAIVLDLLGNCGHRFVQFDGTLAMPTKEAGKYHMKGPVAVCEDVTFKKIIGTLEPIMLSAQAAAKVTVPPLPRYVFNSCCQHPQHCSNRLNEDYQEKILNGVSHLRTIIKQETVKMGVKNHWVLDGAGTLAGVGVGSTGGSNKDLIPDLMGSLANDGVHLTPAGYRKLASAIVESINGLRSGKLTKASTGTNAMSVSGPLTTNRTYFWRGFTSPVGDEEGRQAANRDRRRHGRPGWKPPTHPFHPYKRK